MRPACPGEEGYECVPGVYAGGLCKRCYRRGRWRRDPVQRRHGRDHVKRHQAAARARVVALLGGRCHDCGDDSPADRRLSPVDGLFLAREDPAAEPRRWPEVSTAPWPVIVEWASGIVLLCHPCRFRRESETRTRLGGKFA